MKKTFLFDNKKTGISTTSKNLPLKHLTQRKNVRTFPQSADFS